MIRIGIVGCGTMAAAHLRMAGVLEGRACLAGFADPQIERARELAARHPGSLAVADYHDLIGAVDAVVVATPHDLHYAIGKTFLEAGVHVLMEKPLALNRQECEELVRLDRSPDPVLMVGYVMRHDPLWKKLGNYIKNRDFGDVFQVSIWTEQYTDTARGAWLGRADALGGGQLFSHGCHYIDLLLDWMGDPVSGVHMGTNLGTPWMEREGTSNVILHFATGAMAYHMGTWGARGSRHGYAVHAHCEKGMLELDGARRRIVLHADPSGGDLPSLADKGERLAPKEILLDDLSGTPHKPLEQQWEAFLTCIEKREKPAVSAALSLRSLRVIWKLYEAEDAGTLADLRGL